MGRARIVFLAAALLGLFVLGGAQATPGGLDSGFGSGGAVGVDFGDNDNGYGVAVQSDGKLVVAASTHTTPTNQDFALARLNTDGTLDTSFSTDGKVTTSFGSSNDEPYAIALQPDGKIVAAGYTKGVTIDFAVARYNTNGTLDTSFSSDGKVSTSIGTGEDKIEAVAIQPDGKIVVAGYASTGANDFALARYTTTGSLDTTFSGDGKLTTAIGSGSDISRALVLQPDGKIVAAGQSSNGSNDDFALVRYTSTGSLDTTFDTDGKVTTPIGPGADVATGLALQPDGKLVAAGYSSDGAEYDFAAVRYNANGSRDPSFGGSGKVTTAVGSDNDYGHGVALQPDGRIVVAGVSYSGADADFALVRYDTDGALDATFGSDGRVTTPIGPGNDIPNGVAMQADGRIVVVGSSNNGTDDDAELVRYLGSTLTVTTAGGGSGVVSSSPAGLACSSTCSAPFAAANVALTATPATGSSFIKWSGDCAGTGTGCTLSMDTDHSVTATFELDQTLNVAKQGTGSGTVRSSPAGIDCTSSCSRTYKYGSVVTLKVIPSAKSVFGGWSGDCHGTGSCRVTMSDARTAIATFKIACVVPRVKGKKLPAATRAIERALCSLGHVTEAFSRKVGKGRVISQRPSPGTKRFAGARVVLRVSKGRRP